MQLDELLAAVREYPGLKQKREIQLAAKHLAGAYPHHDHPNGDDTAAIANGDGYDLLASEGFLSELIAADPWFAGWCSVMVNASDIAAMGGRPVAVVNTLWSGDEQAAGLLLEGMGAASKTLQIPVVGGHTNLRGNSTELAVSVLGKAKTLLSSFAAKPGQTLVVAVDLRGRYQPPFLNWNAATWVPAERLRGDLALLPTIAERGLAVAAKDISQAGLLGTAVMLLECSQVGATIDLNAIPKPADVNWKDWLCSFPSFGYLLTTDNEHVDALTQLFSERDIAAYPVGQITDEPLLTVSAYEQLGVFWDLRQPLTGMGQLKRDNESNEVLNA